MLRLRSRELILLTCLVTIGCDRVTKQAAVMRLADRPMQSYLADTVRLDYAENTGAFLSLGADLPVDVRTIVFTGTTAALLLAFAIVAARQRWHGTRLLGVALLAAGGVSNLFDRLAAGYVIDFLNVGVGPVRTGIFNVADVAIMAGVIVMALDGLGHRRIDGA